MRSRLYHCLHAYHRVVSMPFSRSHFEGALEIAGARCLIRKPFTNRYAQAQYHRVPALD
jgi:hypothetical protein